jgi:hypothetical protein
VAAGQLVTLGQNVYFSKPAAMPTCSSGTWYLVRLYYIAISGFITTSLLALSVLGYSWKITVNTVPQSVLSTTSKL